MVREIYSQSRIAMKPDWRFAPSWANWLAMDDDGAWGWHSEKPWWGKDEEWYSEGRYKFDSYDENADSAHADGYSSLEHRP